MRVTMSCTLVAVAVLGLVVDSLASIDDNEREIMLTNFPYDRELDNDVELAKILLIAQRPHYGKRNSEIINSILGLPKNMNKAGRK